MFQQAGVSLRLHVLYLPDYVTETIAISEFPLSAAGVCSKICTAFEAKWDVL